MTGSYNNKKKKILHIIAEFQKSGDKTHEM